MERDDGEYIETELSVVCQRGNTKAQVRIPTLSIQPCGMMREIRQERQIRISIGSWPQAGQFMTRNRPVCGCRQLARAETEDDENRETGTVRRGYQGFSYCHEG